MGAAKIINNKLKNFGTLAILSLFLAACQTTAKVYPLKTDDVRTFSLQSVNVSLPSYAEVTWGKYHRNLALAKEGKPVTMIVEDKNARVEASSTSTSVLSQSVDANDTNTNAHKRLPKTQKIERVMTEEEYTREAITKPLQSAIQTNFNEFMTGNRPVRAEVEIERLNIAKGTGANTLIADFIMYDIDTNAEILRMNNHTIVHQPAGSGRLYYGSPLAALLATAIDAAARAAISQAQKGKRVLRMSELYASSVRNSMAPNLKPKN